MKRKSLTEIYGPKNKRYSIKKKEHHIIGEILSFRGKIRL